MKGEILFKVLKEIGGAVVSGADLLEVIATAGYGSSASKVEYLLQKRSRIRNRKQQLRELEIKELQKYYNLLSYLKRSGFIKEENREKKEFAITRRGLEKLVSLKKQVSESLPSKRLYQSQQSSVYLIVMFDIPEREKRKREWLRAVLRRLSFKLVQKSVWIGKVTLPKNFLIDLRRLKLLPYLEIFEADRLESLEDRF